MLTPPVFVVADVVSAVLMLGLALAFLRMHRATGEPLPLLTGVGFSLLAVGIATVSASEYDLARDADVLDGVRIVAHTSAALTLLFTYASAARHGRPRVPLVLASVAAGLGLLGVLLYLLVPPYAVLPGLHDTILAAHAIQFLAYFGCVVLSATNLLRQPSLRRALVPAAFLAYAFSKYTWLLLDVSSDRTLLPLIYVWRFLMIALFVTTVALPFLSRRAME